MSFYLVHFKADDMLIPPAVGTMETFLSQPTTMSDAKCIIFGRTETCCAFRGISVLML